MGTGRVSDLTLDEIQRFDAGLGEHVPTLAEVIDLVRGQVQLYIELKGQQTPAAAVATLQAKDFIDQAIVGSFYPWLSQKAKFLEPGLRTSILVAWRDRQADFMNWALAVNADFVHPCWENGTPTPHRLLSADLMTSIRRHGLGTILWHEERPEELVELVGAEVEVEVECAGVGFVGAGGAGLDFILGGAGGGMPQDDDVRLRGCAAAARQGVVHRSYCCFFCSASRRSLARSPWRMFVIA